MLYLFEQNDDVAIVEIEELKSFSYGKLIKVIRGCRFRVDCVTDNWAVNRLNLYKPLTDDDKVKYL